MDHEVVNPDGCFLVTQFVYGWHSSGWLDSGSSIEVTESVHLVSDQPIAKIGEPPGGCVALTASHMQLFVPNDLRFQLVDVHGLQDFEVVSLGVDLHGIDMSPCGIKQFFHRHAADFFGIDPIRGNSVFEQMLAIE